MSSFAFFDLDHTLLPHDTQALFCNYVLQRARWRTLLLGGFLPFGVLKGLRLVSTVTAKRAFMSYLWGVKRETLQEWARDFAEREVKPRMYPEMLAIVEEHRAAGRTLILNTASPAFYATEIARAAGFPHCIATQVTVPDRMPFLPQVVGSNNKHEAKIAAMRSRIPEVAAASAEILGESYAYSDSAADLPLLELAGNGFLVHPNASLEAYGKNRGWPVLRPRRPYTGKVGDMYSVARQAVGLYR